jgi:predicted metal-dependent hydrolase
LKNSYIVVNKRGEITLKTSRVPDSYIFELLRKKEFWIRKQLSHVEQNPPIDINLEDEVMLFGDVHSIDIDEAEELRIYLDRVKVSNKSAIIRCYDNFYKFYAKKRPRLSVIHLFGLLYFLQVFYTSF